MRRQPSAVDKALKKECAPVQSNFEKIVIRLAEDFGGQEATRMAR